MIEIFEQLKELRTNQLSGKKHVDRTADLLRENKRHVELLEPTIASIRERDDLVNQKNMIEKKLAWMDFQVAYAACKEISEDLKKTEEKLKEAQDKKKDLQKLVDEKTKDRQKYEKSLSTEVTKKKKCCDELDRIEGEIEKLSTELRNAKCDLNAYIQSAEERDQKIEDNRLVLNTFKQECEKFLEKIGSIEQIENLMLEIDTNNEETRKKIISLTEQRTKVNYQISNVIRPNINAVDNKIKTLNSVADSKLNFIQTNFPDAYEAVMWLRNNQHMFKGRIYEPMVMEISVRSVEYSKYIENCVKIQDLIAFTCEQTDDMNQFLKIMRVDMKLQINAIHSNAANGILPRFKPQVSWKSIVFFIL